MLRYSVVSIISGLVFGILDGIINANTFAVKLYEFYKPIAKKSVNAPAGIIIDLIYGFAMAGIFMLLYKSLPGESGLLKGIVYGLFIWFFRVLMAVISSWMMFNVPFTTLLYTLFTGLIEMLVIGIFYGLALK